MIITDDQLRDLKERNPCNEVAARWVKLRKVSKSWVGPCPLCSRDRGKKSATKFKATDERWMCAACMSGGDVIQLVREVEKLDFAATVDWLGGVREIDPAERARRDAEIKKKHDEQERVAQEFRERERSTLHEMWMRGRPAPGTAVDQYLQLRGLRDAPMTALKCIADMPYYEGGKKNSAVLARAPAMLAQIIRGGKFAGLHVTYLDPKQENGKLQLVDASGEARPAKKMRGSKAGGVIVLQGPTGLQPLPRLYIGEGIETVLSAWCALDALGRAGGARFWCAGDLGNLGGKAAESVRHPTLKNEAGRARSVPGPVPAPGSAGITIPDEVTEIVILGDGDSDPFTTRCAIARACARFARPGRRVVAAFAPDGFDFNDIWRRDRDAVALVALLEAAEPVDSSQMLEDLSRDDPGAVDDGQAAAPSRPLSATRARQTNGDGVAGDRSALPSPDAATAAADPPADGAPSDFSADPPAAGAALSSTGENEGKPSRSGRGPGGARSANRARWNGPPPKYGDDYQERLNRWLAHFPQTELGLIERYVQRWKYELQYCAALGWLAWDGKRWAREGAEAKAVAAGHDTVRAVQDEADSIVETEFDAIVASKPASRKGKKKDEPDDPPIEVWLSDTLRGFGRESETKSRMTLHEHAKAYLSIEIDRLDADQFAINISNGTLIVRRKWDRPLPLGWTVVNDYIRLKPHDPADKITKLAPVDYVAGATCELYDKFMRDVQPDENVRAFLDDWDGYSQLGDPNEQKLVFHYGQGKNGKSTYTAVRLALAGDYGKSIPIASFVNEGKSRAAGQASPDLAMLRRVRTLVTSEPEKGWKLNEGLIKDLTGGDEVQVRELHCAYFALKPEFKLTIAGNHKPNIAGGEKDSGMWRRVVLVPWAVTITKAQQDPHLVDKLKAEGSGILNRWLVGLTRWLDRGLVLPDQVAKATEQFRVDSDPLGRFLDECCRRGENCEAQASAAYAVFQAWCKASGEREWTQTGFGNALRDRGFSKHKKSTFYWLGIELIKGVSDFAVEGTPATGGDNRAAVAPPASSSSDRRAVAEFVRQEQDDDEIPF